MNQSDDKNSTYHYDAFICYSRKDQEFAEKLENTLEHYTPPKDLDVPQRHLIVFRDEGDMSGTEYFQAIQQHLNNSAKLIVLCSPYARQSKLVNDEIRRFAQSNMIRDIIPVLLHGVPSNSSKSGLEDELAFPEALFENNGMPLATSYLGFNVRKNKVNKGFYKGAWYTVLANIYGIRRDELEQRDKRKQIRRRKIATTIVSVVMFALLSLTGVAFWQRNEAQEVSMKPTST